MLAPPLPHDPFLSAPPQEPSRSETLTPHRLSDLLVSARPGSSDQDFQQHLNTLTRRELMALVMTYLIHHPESAS